MSALLSFSERKTFARCFDKSLVARLRCSSDLLGVGGAARSLFPKNFGCNPHFSGALYMSALLSFSERKNIRPLPCISSSQKISGATLIFGSPVYVRLAQFFRFVIPYNLSPFVGIFWAVCNRPVRC